MHWLLFPGQSLNCWTASDFTACLKGKVVGCGLLIGRILPLPMQVLRCSQIAAVKCAEITEAIKSALSGGKQETRLVGSGAQWYVGW